MVNSCTTEPINIFTYSNSTRCHIRWWQQPSTTKKARIHFNDRPTLMNNSRDTATEARVAESMTALSLDRLTQGCQTYRARVTTVESFRLAAVEDRLVTRLDWRCAAWWSRATIARWTADDASAESTCWLTRRGQRPTSTSCWNCDVRITPRRRRRRVMILVWIQRKKYILRR